VRLRPAEGAGKVGMIPLSTNHIRASTPTPPVFSRWTQRVVIGCSGHRQQVKFNASSSAHHRPSSAPSSFSHALFSRHSPLSVPSRRARLACRLRRCLHSHAAASLSLAACPSEAFLLRRAPLSSSPSLAVLKWYVVLCPPCLAVYCAPRRAIRVAP